MKKSTLYNDIIYNFNINTELHEFINDLKANGFEVDEQTIIEIYKMHCEDYKVYYRINEDYYLFAPCCCNPFSISISQYYLPRKLPIRKVIIA